MSLTAFQSTRIFPQESANSEEPLMAPKRSNPSFKLKFFSLPKLNFSLPKLLHVSSSCFPLLQSRTPIPPPDEFLCPISDSLMADPVSLPSGPTFDRPCIEAAIEALRSSNPNLHLCSPSQLQPDPNLKATILSWCRDARHPTPRPLSQPEARKFVQRRMHLLDIVQSVFPFTSDSTRENDQEPLSLQSRISVSPLQLMGELLMKLETEKLLSDEVSVSASVSPRVGTEIVSSTSLAADVLEREILEKLKDKNIASREEAVTTLFELARQSRNLRFSLCNTRILGSVVPKLNPRHSHVQILYSVSFIFVLSSEPSNRVRIVQSGVIPRLAGLLKNRTVRDAREIAVCAFFSLSLEEKNRTSIGSTVGAIAALVEYFSEPTENHGARKFAGFALDNLCVGSPDNISNLAKTTGSVRKLMSVATERSYPKLQRIAVVVMCRVAWVNEAREELVGAGAVKEMVEMLVERVWSVEEERDCLALMYQICDHDEDLFKQLAAEAEAEEVLAKDKEGWGEVGREMVRRMLGVIRREEDENETEEEEMQSVNEQLVDEEEEEEEEGAELGSGSLKMLSFWNVKSVL